MADVTAAVAGTPIAGVLAIGTRSAEPCVAIAAGTGANRVAMLSPSVSFATLPRRRGICGALVGVGARLVVSNVALQTRCLAKGIRARFVWGSSLMDNEVGTMLWQDFLPAALAGGPLPRCTYARGRRRRSPGSQPALDTLRRGVSARKLVVTL